MKMNCSSAVAWTFSTAVTLMFGFSLPTQVFSQDKKKEEQPGDNTIWYDVTTWGIEGRGWPEDEMKGFYTRLPTKAEKVVRRPVWSLSRHSSGMLTRFNTDSTTIKFRYTVGGGLAMPHMPATGVSGVDLYALDTDKKWKWVGVTKPSKGKSIEATMPELDPGMRSYSAYLPLYNSLIKLEIGVPKGAKFQPVAPRKEKPIVFYGTSITHGACASRPGMCYSAILGRRLDVPVINLGFSGNGKMEPEVGALIAEIDAAVYFIDCLPNMNGNLVAERAEPLVRQLRKVRPDTPIILVEDRSFTNSWIRRERRDFHQANRSALIRVYDNLVSSGVKNLYYIKGEDQLGSDTEGATDGSHPNDLGFMRQSDVFEPVLRKALGK